MFCTKCGREIKASQKFCDGCGAPNMGYKEPSEMAKIVNAAVAGDNSAIEKIYNMTYRQGYSVALQIVKNEQDAMDILQEAYISALRNLSSLQNPGKLCSWFNQIVSNRCKDWLKKKKPQLFTDMTPDDSDGEFEDTLENENMTFSPEESVDYTETKRLMQEILDGLPEDQKLCVLMYYYEELSIAEIAETLDCSTGTVKSRLNYARKKIKTDVQELEKKGTKLYNIAPLPFILWMLRANESSVSLPVEFAGKIAANVASQVAGEVTKNVAGQTAENIVGHTVESGTQAATGTGTGQSAVSAGTQAAAKTVASAGAKHLAAKIIAGVVAVSLVGGGGFLAYSKKNSHPTPGGEVTSVASVKDTAKEEKKEIPKLTLTDEQKEQINFASILFDFQQKVNSGNDARQDYTMELSGNKIPKDVLQHVASGIACTNADKLGVEVQQDVEQESVNLTTEQSCDFLKNTFGYKAKDSAALEKVLESGGDDLFLFKYKPSGSADTIYETTMYAQTGEDEYHFYTEVKPWNMDRNTYVTVGIMDITAHKNDKSEIGGFVFDKIEFKADDTQNVGEFVKQAVNCMVRTGEKSYTYDLTGEYDVNKSSQEVFIHYANAMLEYVNGIGEGKEDQTNENGVYDGMVISEKEYQNVCENTLGRTAPYDISTGNEIENGNVHFYGHWFDAYMDVKDVTVVQSMDGSVVATGTIENVESNIMVAEHEGRIVDSEYIYKATGHASDKSEIGIVIEKIEVKPYGESFETETSSNDEVSEASDNGSLTSDQIETIKSELKVPEDADVTWTVGDPYYWDVGQRNLIYVEFEENGELAASASVDADTLELVKEIYIYSK